ncbi:MAG: GIY-YIG nuclease family protein [Verrucomicrobiales bacterium]
MDLIPLGQLIRIEETRNYKFHAARKNDQGVEPLDVFVRDREEWLGWNRWRNPRNEFNREFVFSLIDFYPENARWLFGGIYRILERKSVAGAGGYVIEEVSEYSNLVGRLKIQMPKPSRGRSFLLEKHYDKMVIDEILREPYSGALFPGFENIIVSFHELDAIIRTEKPDWKAALSGVKGVYCIHDLCDGRKYIGSAYGETGIWSRWSQYVYSGHGGNAELRGLVAEKGMEHVRNQFQFSLLEFHPATADDHYIRNRESHWKRLMLSQGDFGYNAN